MAAPNFWVVDAFDLGYYLGGIFGIQNNQYLAGWERNDRSQVHIWDVSAPIISVTPTLITTWEYEYWVTDFILPSRSLPPALINWDSQYVIIGGLTWSGSDPALGVFDFSDTSAPSYVTHIEIPLSFDDDFEISRYGNYVIANDNDSGTLAAIVDFSTITSPSLTSSFNVSSANFDLSGNNVAVDDKVYFGDNNEQKVHVWDISTIGSPSFIAEYDSVGSDWLFTDGTYLYGANASGWFESHSLDPVTVLGQAYGQNYPNAAMEWGDYEETHIIGVRNTGRTHVSAWDVSNTPFVAKYIEIASNSSFGNASELWPPSPKSNNPKGFIVDRDRGVVWLEGRASSGVPSTNSHINLISMTGIPQDDDPGLTGGIMFGLGMGGVGAPACAATWYWNDPYTKSYRCIRALPNGTTTLLTGNISGQHVSEGDTNFVGVAIDQTVAPSGVPLSTTELPDTSVETGSPVALDVGNVVYYTLSGSSPTWKLVRVDYSNPSSPSLTEFPLRSDQDFFSDRSQVMVQDRYIVGCYAGSVYDHLYVIDSQTGAKVGGIPIGTFGPALAYPAKLDDDHVAVTRYAFGTPYYDIYIFNVSNPAAPYLQTTHVTTANVAGAAGFAVGTTLYIRTGNDQLVSMDFSDYGNITSSTTTVDTPGGNGNSYVVGLPVIWNPNNPNEIALTLYDTDFRSYIVRYDIGADPMSPTETGWSLLSGTQRLYIPQQDTDQYARDFAYADPSGSRKYLVQRNLAQGLYWVSCDDPTTLGPCASAGAVPAKGLGTPVIDWDTRVAPVSGVMENQGSGGAAFDLKFTDNGGSVEGRKQLTYASRPDITPNTIRPTWSDWGGKPCDAPITLVGAITAAGQNPSAAYPEISLTVNPDDDGTYGTTNPGYYIDMYVPHRDFGFGAVYLNGFSEIQTDDIWLYYNQVDTLCVITYDPANYYSGSWVVQGGVVHTIYEYVGHGFAEQLPYASGDMWYHDMEECPQCEYDGIGNDHADEIFFFIYSDGAQPSAGTPWDAVVFTKVYRQVPTSADMLALYNDAF